VQGLRDAGVELQREESLMRGAKVSGREWNSVSQCMTCPSTMGSLSPSTGTFGMHLHATSAVWPSKNSLGRGPPSLHLAEEQVFNLSAGNHHAI
jgi:hypothetical protein